MLSTIQKCHSDLSRLTLTTAATSQQQFVQEANRVYMMTQSGAFDYDTAMKDAADALAKRGITTVQYENGKPVTRSIESAVRMNILTSVSQTAANMTLNNCEALDCDLVETSAHIGARPEHEEWQGQIFSRSGSSEKYRPFSVCGLGSPTGICGINCRHSFHPYFEGMERHYTQDDLDEMAGEKVSFNGREMTRYEGEQKLRGMERKIRAYKRRSLTQEAAGVDNTEARRKLGEWQSAAREFTRQTGIARDSAREYVGTPTGKQPTALKPKVQHIFTQSTPINMAVAQKVADMNAKADAFYSATHTLSDFVTKAEITQTMTKLQTATITEGKDLAGKLFVKRDLKDINEVLKAQGFDGKPTVLNKADFIDAVKADTFIAQRTYTAPDKAKLDEYIDMLRNGDFYVDCRTGGRAHGKGMYAAADYTKGKILSRVIDEMAHYQKLGADNRGEYYTMTETLTIDPSARIIDEANIRDEFIFRYSKMLKAQGYTIRQINDKIISSGYLNRDVGVLAATMGYDVIRSVPSPRRADYMVILNRTKLILLGGK
ncbi:MAG: phage minor capsid protein [Treponemataceae bacterium]|nr:phage minor capsid protein [Treponemataceae bacterium]